MRLRRDPPPPRIDCRQAPVYLICSGDQCRARMWSRQRVSRTTLRTRIGFVRLPRDAALICLSKAAKIRTRSQSGVRLDLLLDVVHHRHGSN
jgi:hypothetical protein